MSRYRYRTKSRGRKPSRERVGLERAREHIRQARILSDELAGTDEDVKRYFFSLPGAKLERVLEDYGRRYGDKARDYAEQTMPDWEDGTVKMSGLVAGRLFEFLPAHMAPPEKQGLVEKLWKRMARKSDHTITFGPTNSQAEVRGAVETFLARATDGGRVPATLKERFTWLAEGDAAAVQQMLDHCLTLDRELLSRALDAEVEVLMKHIGQPGLTLTGFRREAAVEGRRVVLLFDPKAKRVEITDGVRNPRASSDQSMAWVWWLVGIAAVLAWMWAANSR